MKLIYKIVFFISMLLTLSAFVVIGAYGLRLGADFKGGSVIELQFDHRPVIEQARAAVSSVAGVTNLTVTPVGDNELIFRLDNITMDTHSKILANLNEKFGNAKEVRFDAIGPVIGKELRNKSIVAISILILVIVIYIALVFRSMSRVLSPWATSFAVVVALIHDVVITIGAFAILGRFFGVEISAVFVAAILTILGYSIADSVIVFDRIRENVIRHGSRQPFADIVHSSIMQTLTRSINSSMTTLLSLTAIYLFGGESVKYFALALIIGIFLGTYSSIFVASPILLWWKSRKAI